MMAKNYKKQEQIKDLNFINGKQQPEATDLEEAILGAMMLEKNGLLDGIRLLVPESFSKKPNALIFQAMAMLFRRSEPVDIVTVVNELRTNGFLDIVGGPYYVSQLTNKVASAANIEYHSRILEQKRMLREQISMAMQVVNDAYEDDADPFFVDEMISREQMRIMTKKDGQIKPLDSLVSDVFLDIEKSIKEQGITGVPSGFSKMDKKTGGWQNSDLIILAARPAMGKTAMAITMAKNASKLAGKKTLIVSGEMSDKQLVKRMISQETGISTERMRDGSMTSEDFVVLNNSYNKVVKSGITILAHTKEMSAIIAMAKRLHQQGLVDQIIFDYLQLMEITGFSGNRTEMVGAISRMMKSLAKELNVPVIALAQLSRAVESRGGDKIPMLSDLRDSGEIEQDADLVMFLYRAEYYGIQSMQINGNDISSDGLAAVIIAKNRHGSLGKVALRFLANTTDFEDYDLYRGYQGDHNPDGYIEPLKPNEEFEGGDTPF